MNDDGRGLTAKENARLRAVLKTAVDNKVVTQQQVADAINRNQGTISGFLNGRQGSSFPAAKRICELLHRDVFEVLGMDLPARKAAVAIVEESAIPHQLQKYLEGRLRTGNSVPQHIVQQALARPFLNGPASLTEEDWDELITDYERIDNNQIRREKLRIMEQRELENTDQSDLESKPKGRPKR